MRASTPRCPQARHKTSNDPQSLPPGHSQDIWERRATRICRHSGRPIHARRRTLRHSRRRQLYCEKLQARRAPHLCLTLSNVALLPCSRCPTSSFRQKQQSMNLKTLLRRCRRSSLSEPFLLRPCSTGRRWLGGHCAPKRRRELSHEHAAKAQSCNTGSPWGGIFCDGIRLTAAHRSMRTTCSEFGVTQEEASHPRETRSGFPDARNWRRRLTCRVGSSCEA